MAKYTETYLEFLEGGGVVPSSSFALITGFEDLFTKRYCASEIGFETEALFTLKLDEKAEAVMPVYADRMAVMLAQMTEIRTSPIKTRYEKREYGKQHSSGKATELPYDVATAIPSSTSEAEVDKHTDEINFKDGLSIDERLRLIDAINGKAKIIVEECLDEFKSLFMGVY